MDDTFLPEEYQLPIYESANQMWYAQSRMSDGADYYSIQEDEKEALEPLLERGFEIVGSGIARIVLRFPETSEWYEYVIKIGRFGSTPIEIGMFQTKSEAQLWNMLRERNEHTTYPVVPLQSWGATYKWCMMEYGVPISDAFADEDEIEHRIEQLKQDLDSCTAISKIEIAEENVVMHDGRAKIGDYGRIDLTGYPFTTISSNGN